MTPLAAIAYKAISLVTDYRAYSRLLSLLDLCLLNRGVYFAPGRFCNVSGATIEDYVQATLKVVQQTLEAMKRTVRGIRPDLLY